jgi:IS30 family transposase
MPRGHYLAEAVKDAIWVLRAEGVSEAEIGRRLGVPKRTVSKYLQRMGGIRPRPSRRPERCMTFAEREEISRGIARGESARAIGRTLGRSHTTVSREINRCGGRRRYRAHVAERAAWERARRPRPTKLELCGELREVVIERLGQDHSPQQISGWLRLSYPDNEEMQVSHETIYRALYVQARGSLRRELTQHLRTRRQKRFARAHSNRGQGPGCIAEMVMISERPPEVSDRAIPGHWEGDLLMGTRDSAIATLVERQTRYCQLVALPDGTNAEPVCEALKGASSRCPSSFAARSPGTRARRWQSTDGSASRPASRSTSAIPEVLAARVQREHERPPSPVLPERQEPRRRDPGRARRGRPQTQRPTPPNARLPDPGRETHRTDRPPPRGRVRALILG